MYKYGRRTTSRIHSVHQHTLTGIRILRLCRANLRIVTVIACECIYIFNIRINARILYLQFFNQFFGNVYPKAIFCIRKKEASST